MHCFFIVFIVSLQALVINGLYFKFFHQRYSTALNGAKEIKPSSVGIVLLAGGKGKRMKSSIPKQFLPVLGKPIFLRSLDVFQSVELESIVSAIVIVLDEAYREEFAYLLEADGRIRWADPGAERQDSVYNGILNIPDKCELVAVHDAARPLVTIHEVINCLQDGMDHGAAVLAVPIKATVKESENGDFVSRTLKREKLWEIHTPQVASRTLFLKGFTKVREERLEVTDDVSVIEAMNLPVKLTLGQYSNIKITTPEDIQIAEQILRSRGIVEVTTFPCPSERYRNGLSKK